jgi:putative transposase
MGAPRATRQVAYRYLFWYYLDDKTAAEQRLAVKQNHPLGNERLYATIERMVGQGREARPRGRPRLDSDVATERVKGQRDLGL